MRRVTGAWSLSRPNLPALLVAVTAFFLPTQLGRHFWPDWAYLQGIRSDYLSPTVYLTDVLILFLFLYVLIKYVLGSLTSGVWRLPRVSPAERAYLTLLAGLVLIALLSIYNAGRPEVAWWHTGKLLEFGLFGLAVGKALGSRTWRRVILTTFLLGCLLQALLGLTQFYLGHSVGLWILGERDFDSSTPGIAQAIIEGKLVLRSYGTLPHPNVLGFFMLVASNLSLYLSWRSKDYPSKVWWAVLMILFSLTVLTSLSRVALLLWLASSGLITGYFYRPTRLAFSRRGLGVTAGLLLATLLFLPPVWSRFTSLVDVDSQTVSRRIELSQDAVTFWREHPWSGIGAGNFVVRLVELSQQEVVRFLQPAHNLYLLALSEVGIIGLLFLATLLGLAGLRGYRAYRWLLLLLVVEVAIAGLFDHFWWSLQQGGLLFWSTIGGLFSRMVAPEVIPGRPPEPPS